MLTAAEIIKKLNLKPHPNEGGFFVETYRSTSQILASSLPSTYTGPRNCGTAIYYLLTPETVSAMHLLPGDEIFHFYLGHPVEMLQLKPDGTDECLIIGPDLLRGMRPQVVVPGGVWQGSKLVAGGSFALLGATMAPGFDYADYRHGNRESLSARYPSQTARIAALTPF